MYLRSTIVTFFACAYKRKQHARLRARSIVHETKGVKTNAQHKQHDTKALQSDVGHELNYTIQSYVKH